MDRRRLLKLWADKDLTEYIQRQARRHFACEIEQERAVDEAWDQIMAMVGWPRLEVVKRRGYMAINNFYDREHRKHLRLPGTDGNITTTKLPKNGNG